MNTVSSRLTDAWQQSPIGENTLCASLREPPWCIVGVVSQQEGVSLPGRTDLTVRAESPGMFSFEILMHCGSWGVLWGVVSPAGVMSACFPDDCAIGGGARAYTHTPTHTHTLIYGYTAAQQDPAFVGSEYIQRVHSEKMHIYSIYALTNTHSDAHTVGRYTHTPWCSCCKHMGDR